MLIIFIILQYFYILPRAAFKSSVGRQLSIPGIGPWGGHWIFSPKSSFINQIFRQKYYLKSRITSNYLLLFIDLLPITNIMTCFTFSDLGYYAASVVHNFCLEMKKEADVYGVTVYSLPHLTRVARQPASAPSFRSDIQTLAVWMIWCSNFYQIEYVIFIIRILICNKEFLSILAYSNTTFLNPEEVYV